MHLSSQQVFLTTPPSPVLPSKPPVFLSLRSRTHGFLYLSFPFLFSILYPSMLSFLSIIRSFYLSDSTKRFGLLQILLPSRFPSINCRDLNPKLHKTQDQGKMSSLHNHFINIFSQRQSHNIIKQKANLHLVKNISYKWAFIPIIMEYYRIKSLNPHSYLFF